MISIHRANTFSDALRPELKNAWESSRNLLGELADQLEVPFDEAAQALFLIGKDAEDLVPSNSVADNERFAILTGTSKDGLTKRVLMVPTRELSTKNMHLAPFIETHSRLIAWWLMTLWRSSDLVESAWELGNAGRFISAAACSRALLETAAALWCDARDLAQLWCEKKLRGISMKTAWQDRYDLNNWIWHTVYGAKFDSRAPNLAKGWANLSRTNVLGHVEKLAKSLPTLDLQTHYQWLCNTVHPSCGGTFAMSSPLVSHVSDTHAFAWYAPFLTHLRTRGEQVSERHIQEAIVVTAIAAARIVVQSLDDSLRIIDDIGLTTGAPKMATFNYWRRLQVTTRKQLCPCRSGLTFEKCHHRWGEPTTPITAGFQWDDL
jgi:hypothetical protein